MATTITRAVLESYLKCRYKGHLRLTGQQGRTSDYENLLIDARNEIRSAAACKLMARQKESDVVRNFTATLAVLKRGLPLLLDATLEAEGLSICVDALQKVTGASKLGDFHYIPVLFFESRRIRTEQRLLLDLDALCLSRLQGRMPSSGIVWHGKECRSTRVRLSTDLRKIERLLDEITQTNAPDSPPRLILNDHCQVCEFRQRCHDQAMREDNLSLLRGISDKEVKSYARKGILTLTQLAHTFRPRRKGKRTPPRGERHFHALQALAVRDKKVYVLGSAQLPSSPVRVYLDVEGNPEEGFDYLVGLIVVEGDQEQRYSFWADHKEQEQQIFEQFLSVVTRYDDLLVFCYGSYERTFLKRMRKGAKRKKDVDRILKSLVNVLSLIYAHFYFPTYSNGLKELGACLGCTWTDPDASGIQSIVWRKRWEDTRDEQWKHTLATYNMVVCAALLGLAEFINAAIETATGLPSNTTGVPPIASVQELDRLGNDRKWRKVSFFHPDFDYINNCAYFDYQRQRVYVRTSKLLKKNHRRSHEERNRKLRVSHRVRFTTSKCPLCGATEVIELEEGRRGTSKAPRVKRAFDLVFTSGSIKRRVIECRAPVYECRGCGRIFVPDRYERLAKHFHGLMSWAMFEHIAHRISYGILSEMLKECFGLTASRSELHMVKSLMAQYYQRGYKRLLKKLLSGRVLHIDETEVKLRTGKGYVWVFTSLEEVVFLYRPTREGSFLQKLLKNFHGVLVSDFYAAYDSIDCPQQK
ncbi:MAG: TM0106 family RecB-like putative nuclease, partial [Planctomycetaceae bacterium]|nr:TM0106 family RecB-like putative nuclease [Planctomycetaceae bacterium]